MLLPSLAREWRGELTEAAEAQSFAVYAVNLRQKLLQPPLKRRTVLALDPGLRTGCKLAVVSDTGAPLHSATLMLQGGGGAAMAKGAEAIRELLRRYSVDLVVIGNGTGSRDAENAVVEALRMHAEEKDEKSDNRSSSSASSSCKEEVRYTIVDEAGASVYSASPLATRELPNLDVSIRGAVSLARRVQDPLSELVKIDPKALGVGMYQHDVNQGALAEELARVVEGAVNAVGVDVNQASPSLLAHVAGLTRRTSENIIAAREASPGGRFASVAEVRAVKGVGPKAFEQAAGFLRIFGGSEPLDATDVHPESFGDVRRACSLLNGKNGNNGKKGKGGGEEKNGKEKGKGTNRRTKKGTRSKRGKRWARSPGACTSARARSPRWLARWAWGTRRCGTPLRPCGAARATTRATTCSECRPRPS